MNDPGAAGAPPVPAERLALIRTVFGGAFMGVANVIPGVSGGTMILAFGLYERFVEAVADLTRLKFRLGSMIFLGLLAAAAGVAILVSVGPINWGLEHHPHIMFASFIGLTLGGVPLLWRELRPLRPSGLMAMAGGVAFIGALSIVLSDLDLPSNFVVLFAAGVIASAAMVLPGISGSYLLLAMGLYFPITRGVDQLKDAMKALDVDAAMTPALGVVLPVGLGVLVGIAALANILKALLDRFHQPTMGGLLGLLLGSVISLYPFREPGHRDPFEAAAPLTALNVALVLGCIAGGFAVTYAISHLGAPKGKS